MLLPDVRIIASWATALNRVRSTGIGSVDRQTRILLFVVLMFGAGNSCRTLERGVPSEVRGGAVGGISDNTCAVPLVLDITVVDRAGVPLPDVKVAYRATSGGADWWRTANGFTERDGRLYAPGCYQSSADYDAHPPSSGADLAIALSKPGFTSQTVSYPVSADTLVGDRSGVVHTGMRWTGIPVTIRATMSRQ